MPPNVPFSLNFRRAHGAGGRGRLRAAGFTLIELLMVAALVVVLVGVFAVTLGGRGGEGAALANAQDIVAGLVGSARAQAALHQTMARLVVQAEPAAGSATDASAYLRTLQVVRAALDSGGGAVWVASAMPVTLPEPVRVVPPAVMAAGEPRYNTAPGGDGADSSNSRLDQDAAFHCFGSSHAPGAASVAQYFGAAGRSGRVLFLEFAPNGSLASNGSDPFALLVLEIPPAGDPQQTVANRAAVRGILVRRNGSVSRLDAAGGF